ncbi:hypothetical protein [Mucilaginibacter sp.]|uniref:hypothetical protein n=1 Tax=Mucilaginibacter sp. TaxID=1882438 RepID=UPI00284BD716|nr:hypothetical protein [Mucilaginibacter sp.]MDR3693471.1 hypothetical protein [Mucilaginibacter sp.]
MKHLNKLFAIVIFLPFFSVAQSNYQPGYVVTTAGDTVRGFIDYKDWDSNPEAISFKSTPGDPAKKNFTLNDITFFNITGFAGYKRYTCSISTDITNTNNLVDGRDTSFKVATVFLQVLQQGKNLTLYAYTNAQKTRFYIGETPAYSPVELIFRRYFDSGNKGGNTVNENTYQKQLFALANKYNSLDEKTTALLENSNYQKADLLTIVSRINNISKADFEKKYADHGKFNLYAGVALNILSTTSSPNSSYTLGGGGSSTSSLPAFNIGMDFVPDPNGRAEFRVDLSANLGQFNSQYQLKVSPGGVVKASYNTLGIFLTPMALYNFYNAPNFKFYAGVGVSLTYDNYTSVYFQNQNSVNGTPLEQYDFNRFNNTFLLKAGFRIQKSWEIYFNYYTATPSTKGGYFQLSNSLKQVGVNYFFGK